jgi:hypothetical protein
MNGAVVTAFFAAAIPAFFTPGPNNLMLMTSSARFGLGRTVPHMIGVVLGFPLMVLLVGLGLGEVFDAFPVLKTVLKFVAAKKPVTTASAIGALEFFTSRLLPQYQAVHLAAQQTSVQGGTGDRDAYL